MNDRRRSSVGRRYRQWLFGLGCVLATLPTVQAAQVLQVAAGAFHACALDSDGAVACWGDNMYGQLGNGTWAGNTMPVAVSNLSNVAAIAAGANHTCALKHDGTVACWGYNRWGQVGHETLPDASVNTPTIVAGLTGIVTIAAGGSHTCAMERDGSVACWGDNQNGQLGDGSSSMFSTEPVTVVDLSGTVAITAGGAHTCALRSDATAVCWGNNYSGQLGDGTTNSTNRPIRIQDLSEVVSIAAGGGHTCAIRSDGIVACWGSGLFGQLGNGATMDSSTPIMVHGLSEVSAIAAGMSHTCARKNDNSAVCWGGNYNGQLGNGTATDSSAPIVVHGLSDVSAITTGAYFTCAVAHTGIVVCWGSNNLGQIGNGLSSNTSAPVAVSEPGDLMAIAAGLNHTCAVRDDGTTVCWGNNGVGQLGDGTTVDSPMPIAVDGLSETTTIEAGSGHTCALKKNGTVACWGSNTEGQLGNFWPPTISPTPITVVGLTDVVAVAAGSHHNCALIGDGTVACWGEGRYGKLGNGDDENSPIPVAVGGLSQVMGITAGPDHSCALKRDGTMVCWGRNNRGQLGNDSLLDSSVPVAVSGLSGVSTITAGGEGRSLQDSYTCATRIDGTAACWGANWYGQLGNGSQWANSLTPSAVVDLSDAKTIAAGLYHTCAVKNDGTAACWGLGSEGELGSGSRISGSQSPIAVMGLFDATTIATGGSHTCALKLGGKAVCWGWNGQGQLGHNFPDYYTTPQLVRWGESIFADGFDE